MPEVVARVQASFLRNLAALLWGAVWTVLGTLPPVITELWFDFTKYKDYGVDWEKMAWSAAMGAGPALGMYLLKHRALLAIPDQFQAILDAAEQKNVPSQNERLYGTEGDK